MEKLEASFFERAQATRRTLLIPHALSDTLTGQGDARNVQKYLPRRGRMNPIIMGGGEGSASGYGLDMDTEWIRMEQVQEYAVYCKNTK